MKEYYKVSAETSRAFMLFFASIDTALSAYIYNEKSDIIAVFALCLFIVATSTSVILYYNAMDNLKKLAQREAKKNGNHGIHIKSNYRMD